MLSIDAPLQSVSFIYVHFHPVQSIKFYRLNVPFRIGQFVTSDILYFLIAENRLFGSNVGTERKERILKRLIRLLSVIYVFFYQNVYKFRKWIFLDEKGSLTKISRLLAGTTLFSSETLRSLRSVGELFPLR